MDFDFTKEPGTLKIKPEMKSKVSPKLSIITPFYNSGKFFEQTYNCVINQTFPWFEWIIIDDGSTQPEDLELLKNLSNKDIRIKLLRKDNGGIASARNLAIQQSETDIIIPLDSDDLIAPTYLEVVYWTLYFNPEAAWCYTDTVGFHDENYLWRKSFSPTLMKTYNLLVCTAAIRKPVLLECGSYREGEKHYNEDWNLWLNILSKGYYPVHINEYLFWYRRTNTGVLSIVKEDKEISKRNELLITEAAKKVDVNIVSIEYPRIQDYNLFSIPKRSEWKELSLIHILLNQDCVFLLFYYRFVQLFIYYLALCDR